MRFFFYGTLIDRDVRAHVIGPEAAGWRISEAILRDWRTVRIAGRPYPAIVPRRGETAVGILAEGIRNEHLPRLIAYEGAEYALRTLEVEVAPAADGSAEEALMVTAYAFAASSACNVIPSGWRFSDWERRHRRATIAALRARRPV